MANRRRIVADLGNSRLKWALVGLDGFLTGSIALPVDDPDAWAVAFGDCALSSQDVWAISTVNPPVADRLARFLSDQRVSTIRWYRSAAEVPINHDVEGPETGGADRALAVLAAKEFHAPDRPGLVVSCGTAITVERISADGVWQGGAIAPGLGLSARALHQLTAQLPQINVPEAPTPWGRGTEAALAAGLFWGSVGAVRELLNRQAEGLSPLPWVDWTGGDAARLAPWIDWPGSRVVPDLVLLGLARAAFFNESPVS
ncbi:MAG: type III pantothenate kinase [Isosphaeraceae bacterium]